jgi:hypothetical protein
MKNFLLIIYFIVIVSPRAGMAQSLRADCDNGIELLRNDLLSMLNKIPALPPVVQVYIAAKERFDELNRMKNEGQYTECVSESERVLRITRPYGNRR